MPARQIASGQRDPFTARHWNQRDIECVLPPPMRRGPTVDDVTQSLLGRMLDASGWASLLGVPDGSRIELSPELFDGHLGVFAKVLHPWYAEVSERFLYRDADGDLAIQNDYFAIADTAPALIGTRILAHQVREASRLGFRYIGTDAAGAPGSALVGYYVWARLGFNGEIPAIVRRRLEVQQLPELHGCRDVLDLMERPGGARWWRQNGREYEGIFDLWPGSRSQLTLERYTREKGIRIGRAK